MVFFSVKPIKAIMEKDMTTCEFRVPPLVLSDTNFWECRVSTTGGQDSGKFKITVKGKKASRVTIAGSSCAILYAKS